jgi:hypothetical protein
MRYIHILLLFVCGNVFPQSVLFNNKIATNSNVIINRQEHPPKASNVYVSGLYLIGSVRTANYTYEDLNGDIESGTTYQWYRANDAIGTGQASISGATNSTYTLVSADSLKYVYVGVIPKNAKATGNEVLSEKECLDNHVFYFKSVQPASINQVTLTYAITAGSVVYIKWGDGSAAAQMTGTTIASNYATNNKTYTISIYGDLTQVQSFTISSEATVSNLNINDFAIKMPRLTYLYLLGLSSNITGSISSLPAELTYLFLHSCGTSLTGSISSLPVGLTYLQLNTLGTNFTGSISSLPVGLTYLNLYNLGTNFTGSINSLPTGLTYLNLYDLGTNFTGSISSLPNALTVLYLYKLGTNIDITTGTMKAWEATAITITSGYITASIDGFLNAWAATVTGTTAKTITLSGTGAGVANQARSAASNDAVTHLTDIHAKSILTTP